MASSSGNSSGSLQIQSSGPKEGLMDQRKRKRMQSNRESARRSRMRKQTHLNDLTAQIARLKEENDQIHTNLSITSQHYLNIEAENSVLRAQMGELSQRLDALNDILNYLDASKGVFGSGVFEAIPESYMNDSWNSMYFNQPIMASADLFLY
ncbi:BZIP transcription factor [Actinidia chinensis var. chinensis]|uniref:BZIP transcription factor n=1 Tax=Actinidia chinensis var. chinensis TaxID=1590841 RepID=A0A2R6R046_ACTCC|nr:BZIP transcription factor [Actinidia chinensis var. chinensis]